VTGVLVVAAMAGVTRVAEVARGRPVAAVHGGWRLVVHRVVNGVVLQLHHASTIYP
jgi:hypothetical protein